MPRRSPANSAAQDALNPAAYALLRAVFRYSHLSSRQVCSLLYSPGSLTYVQTKLKHLTDAGLLQRVWLPRPSAHGSAPSVYTLARKGLNQLGALGLDVEQRYRPTERREHSYLFLEHTLAVNDVLIGAELLCRSVPQLELAGMLHERDLKRTPVPVQDDDGHMITVAPDAWLDLRVNSSYQVCLALELDRGTEEQKAWRRKVRGLLAYASGPYQEAHQTTSLTILVVATPGDKRAAQLIRWTEAELTAKSAKHRADLFAFTGLGPHTIAPSDLLVTHRWTQPFCTDHFAVIEYT